MTQFRNSYYLMRHGQSEANVAGIIVSAPSIGTTAYGLTAEGERQVRASLAHFDGPRPARVISSDFLRARQTAALAARHFELPSPELDAGLRERFFGRWEGLADSGYGQVWQQDEADTDGCMDNARQDAGNRGEGSVEPVSCVLQRGLDTLRALETRHAGEVLLLVSHGDWVQILQTAFVGLAACAHRRISHHQTAEIRPLVSRGQSWPSGFLIR
ncbi:histidine phosphatase family protein [Marinobacterium sedimentorum]|uniref:histidine phosphatase family protein n=1 Tax=Marinobacterium sedimentorum TaxID=2927804 RepID=UPI0020C73BBD|nr:histidine phosphatase family protein [Marinobacterium sedimentorum]MCP8688383.1 histidine phosphatase family protein [Marinobacterium sedimentorum]